ncbi:MAG: type II toxin-antitoxin system RelE/ParE family toxin [Rhodocyclaceae bacterium]|nr:type II toxin-antitoxin system RelE/ParE family toxin [Rhodocyclaceae bacterium]
MQCYEVLLTEDAERDLEALFEYIVERDSLTAANRGLDRMEKVIASLSSLPERGSFPRELLALGIKDYRQIFFKPYRLIYRIVDARAYIYLIVDGRRDMQTLLARRLLSS